MFIFNLFKGVPPQHCASYTEVGSKTGIMPCAYPRRVGSCDRDAAFCSLGCHEARLSGQTENKIY